MTRVVRFDSDPEYLDDTTDQTPSSPGSQYPVTCSGEFDDRHEYPSTLALGIISLLPESLVSVQTPPMSPPVGPSFTPYYFTTPLSPYSYFGLESSTVFPTQRDVTSGTLMNINDIYSVPLNSPLQSFQYPPGNVLGAHVATYKSPTEDSPSLQLYHENGLHASLSYGLRQMFYDMSTPPNSPDSGIMESDLVGPYLDHPATIRHLEVIRIRHKSLLVVFRIQAGEPKTRLRVSDILHGIYGALQQPSAPAGITHNGTPRKWIDTLPEDQWRMYGLKTLGDDLSFCEIETTNG